MQSPPYERRRQAMRSRSTPLKASSMLDGSGTMTVQPGKSITLLQRRIEGSPHVGRVPQHSDRVGGNRVAIGVAQPVTPAFASQNADLFMHWVDNVDDESSAEKVNGASVHGAEGPSPIQGPVPPPVRLKPALLEPVISYQGELSPKVEVPSDCPCRGSMKGRSGKPPTGTRKIGQLQQPAKIGRIDRSRQD